MISDYTMADNNLKLFFTAETQRSLRVNLIKTNRETAIGFGSTFQDFFQFCIYRAECFIFRYLPANKRCFSLRSQRLCGENILFGFIIPMMRQRIPGAIGTERE